MPLRLGRKLRDQERDGQRPDHRRQYDERSPGARRSEQVGVVPDDELPEEEQIVHKADQVPESHRAEPSHDPDRKGEDREVREADTMGFLCRRRRLIRGSDTCGGGGPIGRRQGGLVR